MSKESPFLGNFGSATEKFEEIQKAQSVLASRFLNSGLELQKKQSELLGSIIKNQIAFGNSLFSEALNIINDNARSNGAKEQKGKA